MSKFIDRALELLNHQDMDGLQTELHSLEKAWKFCNQVRETAEENNRSLVKQNNELRLAAQEILEDKKRLVANHDQIRAGLQQQMIQSEIARQAELAGLVEDNVRLRQQVRQLEQDVRRLQKRVSGG